jgi:DNA adenine methylase
VKPPRRPILRYHGGKWILAPWIIGHFPPHRVYVEPFGGAASVLMRKPRSYAEVYNDLDDEIVNVFQVLRDPGEAARLRGLLELTPYSRTEFFRSYEQTSDPIERARRRIVRALQSFGTTSGKLNRTGFRATPWRSGGSNGVADWSSYPQALESLTRRLQGVCIECRPAAEVIAQQDAPEVLFYCDPPYPHSTRSAIRWPSDRERAYGRDMSDDDHRALAEQLRAVRGMVVLSTYESDLYRELFAGWRVERRETLADGARARTEVLYLNPAAVSARAQATIDEATA